MIFLMLSLTLKPTIFFYDNDKPITHTHIYEYRRSTHSSSWQRLSDLLSLQSQVSEANDLFAFPMLKNVNAQRQLIPQYEDINFSHMQQVKKAITMYGPHLPFTNNRGDNRGWDGWMASLTLWMWVWVNSGSWWWTGRPGMLQFMGSQRVRHNRVTELNWSHVRLFVTPII